jgi:hypothetical protein
MFANHILVIHYMTLQHYIWLVLCDLSLMTIRWKMPCQTFNDCLSFVTRPLQLRAFSHVMFMLTTKLVIYGIYGVIDLKFSSSVSGWPIAFVVNLKSFRDPLSLFPQRRMNHIPWCNLRCFCFHCEGCKVSCFMWIDPMSFLPFPFSIFVGRLTLCYQLMTFAPWWTWLSLTPLEKTWSLSYFISWGGCNDGSLGKGRTLPRSALNKHIFPPCHESLRVFTPTSRRLFPLTC